MSKTYAGHETFVRFGSQGTVHTAATEWYLWDTTDADGLSLNEEPIDRDITWGGRGRRSATRRKGGQMPGGGLGAYPWAQDDESKPVLMILNNFFQNYTMGTVSGTIYLPAFSPCGTQKDSGDWYFLTLQKDTAVPGDGEQYLDCIANTLSIDYTAGEMLTITPEYKAISGSNSITVSGTGEPISAAYVESHQVSFTWQGTTIYTQAMNITLNNNLPDRKGPGQRGRQAFHLGNLTGEWSLDMWREEDTAAWFRDTFDADTVGTLIVPWALSGTHDTGDAYQGTITAYCMMNDPELSAQQGDLVDTISGVTVIDSGPTVEVSTSLTAW